MKPNGLVAAASTTSQTLMPSRSHISASSFTRPMFTARNVFSSSFTISATCGRADLDDRVDRRRVERLGERRARRRRAADDLRHVARREVRVARIDALGRERQEEIASGHQAALLENRPDDFVRSTRIGGRFEDDELPGMQVLGNHLDGRDDVGEVRVLGLPERRRHADVDRVERLDDRRVAAWPRACPASRNWATSAVGTSGMYDSPRLIGVDLARVEVDAGRLEAGARQLDGERQADVAEADHADVGGAADGVSARGLQRVADEGGR